jgi:AcrR family transcriptional regulator
MGRREAQKARRQQAIFEVAIRLFREKGFAATTVDEIAAAADIAKGTFFNYFPTKEAVLLHLNELLITRLAATVEATPGFAELPAQEQVGRIFDALAESIVGQHELLRVAAAVTLMHQPARNEFDRQIETHFDTLLTSIAAHGQASGEFRADLPAAELGLLLRQIYFLTLLDWIERPQLALAPLLRRNLSLLIAGLKGPTRG